MQMDYLDWIDGMTRRILLRQAPEQTLDAPKMRGTRRRPKLPAVLPTLFGEHEGAEGRMAKASDIAGVSGRGGSRLAIDATGKWSSLS